MVYLLKDKLRSRYRRKRKEIASQHKEDLSTMICNRICMRICSFGKIALYKAIDGEVDLSLLIRKLRSRVLLPVTEGANMTFCDIYGNISLPDIIVVPLVSFDCELNRLGFGGGFYDKYLRKYKHIPTIGAAFDCQLCPAIPVLLHDMRLKTVVTEQCIYS